MRKVLPILVLLLASVFASPAVAADFSGDPVSTVGDETTSTAIPLVDLGTPACWACPTFSAPKDVTDPNCVSAVKIAGGTPEDLAKCTMTYQASWSSATPPTSTDIQSMQAVEPTLSATTASTRRCRTWKQWYTAASYHEQHTGKMCYDHVNVYAAPWGGYHRCGDWWGFGYTASEIKCYAQRINNSLFQGGYYRQQWDSVHWSFLVQGFPVSFTRKMHTNIFPSGTITFHNN